MREHLLIIAFVFLGVNLFGQIKLGITTGAQFAHTRSGNTNTDSRFAYNFGVTSLIDLTSSIQLNTQLLFIGKGYKYYNSFEQRNLVKPVYFELPVVARFHFKTTENTGVFIGLGGYYAAGVGGKETYYINDERLENKIEFGSSINAVLTKSDGGAVMQIGGNFRDNFEGCLFYDMGLANIIPNTTTLTYNRVIGFNLAWFIPSGKRDN